ncbi:MAG: NAD(P)/FAD-dependent oxidoreductase [Comamonadaceae bacterium]|nr:MAG: NAD(P)/FAD-dependent oxidoreductase [Comamonadaceae bacterium]
MFDVAVIGAGAAGMMCAAVAGQRGARVVLIDHASKLAEKIRISGGGRCNFTNLGTQPVHFISENPHFCRSALAGYTPQDFLALLREHGVTWHEKHRGQLFCDTSSEAIIDVLRAECDRARVQWRMPCSVEAVEQTEHGFVLMTGAGRIEARSLVVATGGMAIPQLGATDFGLKLARQFGLKVVEPRPALVPLTFAGPAWVPFVPLAGVALEAAVTTGTGKHRTTFLEDVLFTHRGLSGPGILQISSYWDPNTPISIDLAPGRDLAQELMAARHGNRQQLATVLAGLWPKRLAEIWLADLATERLADVPDRALRALGQALHQWELVPNGTQGYKKAEVMRGGVDTRQLDQRSMQARNVRGLHFIGEVVDVTGWLGGYNFQWAWASAVACARAISL